MWSTSSGEKRPRNSCHLIPTHCSCCFRPASQHRAPLQTRFWLTQSSPLFPLLTRRQPPEELRCVQCHSRPFQGLRNPSSFPIPPPPQNLICTPTFHHHHPELDKQTTTSSLQINYHFPFAVFPNSNSDASISSPTTTNKQVSINRRHALQVQGRAPLREAQG